MGEVAYLADPLLELTRVSSRERARLLVALLAASAAHLATAWAVTRLEHRQTRKIEPIVEVVDIDLPKPPLPPEPPKPEEPLPKAPEPLHHTRAPSSPARAAKVVTRAPDPNEPVDLTGSFVIGSAATYVGGTSSATGTSPVVIHGKTAGTAPGGSPGSPDLARHPALGEAANWQCPFPPEANADHIDHAVVTIRVEVAASGTARSVTVVKDPGHGFAREARRCALSKKWSPALDREGAAVAGSAIVNVRFAR
jgi:protein TonB